jgi:hypothetical protein
MTAPSRWRLKEVGEVKRWRKVKRCSRCHGRKLQLRVGRRVRNAWRRTYDDGTR